jgi:hypothetical protein
MYGPRCRIRGLGPVIRDRLAIHHTINIAPSHKLKAMVICRPDLPEHCWQVVNIENAHYIAQLGLCSHNAKRLVSGSYSFALAEEELSIPHHVLHSFEECIKIARQRLLLPQPANA